MPKSLRRRRVAREPSAKLIDRRLTIENDAVECEAVNASSIEILESQSIPRETPRIMKKKAKHCNIKRDDIFQRCEATGSPYSKSHDRRLKRKAKEQIAGGFSDLQLAIAAVHQSSPPIEEPPARENLADQQPSIHMKCSRIGKGKSATLSGSQRRHALELEKVRHPLILSNPDFVSDPFHAIRIHAQNTLIKRQIPTHP